MTPPFRAEHVGSLLRPPEVARARDAGAGGRITSQQLRAIEDKAIAAAVKRQEELGLEGVTDGEMRRESWHMDFYRQIGGLAKADEVVQVPFKTEAGDLAFTVEGVQVAGRLRLDKTIFGDDFAYLKSIAKATPKLTIPSPSVLHRRGGRLLDKATHPHLAAIYPDIEQVWRDLSDVYAAEIVALGKLGCSYLQIEDT